MRIVFVLNSPVWGGLERYTVDIASGLAEKGHDVHAVVTPGGPVERRLTQASVTLHPLALGLMVGWHARIGSLNEPLFALDLYANTRREALRRLLARIAADRPIDLLHAQHVKEKLWVTDIGRQMGVPVAWTVHAPLEPWMRRGVPGRVHRWARGRVSGILAVNDAARKDYAEFGYALEAMTTVHNGIRLDEYSGGERDRARAALGVADDECLVLMPARPYEGKGVGVLLDAVATLRTDSWTLTGGRPIKVAVAGESRHVERFSVRARELGVGDVVAFLGHRDDMRDLYAASDVVTLPSLFEGLPYVIIEAMAASRPVVATGVGGVPEMIRSDVEGLLVPPRDPHALAEALARMAHDRGAASAMAEAGRRRAETAFGLERMVRQTETALTSLCERRTTR